MAGSKPTNFPSEEPKFFEFSKFDGLNTKAKRPGIDDQQSPWLENFYPIGAYNLRTMYGKGSNLFAATGGKSIVYFYCYNIGTTPFIFVCFSDGTGSQINVNTGVETVISSTVGTFYSGTNLPQGAQWGSQYLQIIASTSTSAYFIWDGTILYSPGSIGPFATADIIQGGTGYTGTPSIAITGGGGAAATATAIITNGSLTGFTVTNAGSGFTSEPIATITGGGPPAGGAVNSIIIINGGSNYTAAPAVTFSSGAATGTAVVSGGAVVSVTVTAGGAYTAQPTISFGGPGTGAVGLVLVTGLAAIRLPIMTSGVSGTAIENYQGRTWIANGSVITFSAPNSLNNFATSSGGGTFPSTDSNLRVAWNRLVSSNGFLYLLGDSSVSVISNVQTAGSPPSTSFNVSNIDPQIGTPWRDSVSVFGRAIVLGATSGIYAAYGGAVEKISDMLDGLFLGSPNIPTTGGMTGFPSAAVSTIFDIKTYMFLFTGTDTSVTPSVTRPMLAMWEGKKWFIGSQEVNLIFIASQEFNGVLQAWATDGTNLFKIFNTASMTLSKKAQSKLWAGDSMIIFKNTFRQYYDIVLNSADAAATTINIDTDVTTTATSTSLLFALTFVNNTNGVIQFQNNALQNLTFTVPGLGISGSDVNASGKLLGLTISTFNQDETLVDALLLYENTTPFA